MRKKKKIVITILLFILIITCIIYNIFLSDTNTSYALSRYGSRGDEVKQIQTKLKRWGYYNGSIDGVYGSQTLAAVKWFNQKMD